MTKLFKKKDPSALRSVDLRIRLTQKEGEKIRHSASVRKMDVSEFMRRAALGRKADVDHETEIVLALSDFTRAIRELYAAMVERGLKPPEQLLGGAILAARDAILRISK